jgi:hypothetical protein
MLHALPSSPCPPPRQVLGRSFFVSPSDSVAMIAANAQEAIPYFSKGLKVRRPPPPPGGRARPPLLQQPGTPQDSLEKRLMAIVLPSPAPPPLLLHREHLS